MNTLDIWKKYRHNENFERKPGTYSYCDGRPAITITTEEYQSLEVFRVETDDAFANIGDDNYAFACPLIVIKTGEKQYLVNTEGYGYARYVAPLVVVDTIQG